MTSKDDTTLVLLVQSSKRLFCYFHITDSKVKEFEEIHGINSWSNSKAVIKVFSVKNGKVKEINEIQLESNIDSLYINLDRDNLTVFIKLGRILPSNTFMSIATSNKVSTPRSTEFHTIMKSVSSEFI